MHSYNDVIEASIKYFNGSEISAKVFADKYALRDNDGNILELTPDEMHHRLAKEFARIEAKKFKNPIGEDEIYQYFKDFKYIIPQGSPMAGIGNPYQILSLSNCYVVDTHDSYGGICLTDQYIAQISKRRGGIGYDISPLRPKNTSVKNAARTTTGAISFMHRFDRTGQEVGQAGRRSAQMISISVHHPDIMEFITIKNDEKLVTGANISVRLSNEFLQAVKDNTEYELRWPIEGKKVISKQMSAKKVWDAIIHNAWLRAEPGILIWDNIIKESPADCYSKFGFKTCSTNPCQPKWAKFLTPGGIRELKDINVGDYIWSQEGWTPVLKKWSTGIKKIYKYSTNAGVFYGTSNHKVLSYGQKIEVELAENIDYLVGEYHSNVILDNQTIMDGLVIGDGSVHKASNNLVYLYIGNDDKDYFESEIKNYISNYRPGITEEAYEIKTTITHEELPLTFDRVIPSRFLYGNRNIVCSFLRGLYSANGSVCDNRITLKSSSLDIIEGVQMMLSSVGIASYYTTNKPSLTRFSNGNYLCKQSYDLNITTDREKFIAIIGFIQQYKNNKIKIVKSCKPPKKSYDIKNIEFISEEEVFDITVTNNSHTYWTQCCNVSNCGEIPLSCYDSCRLMVLNLFNFVVYPYTKRAVFDYRRFLFYAERMQRLMDDLVDLELECINRIIKKVEQDPEPDHVKQVELHLWSEIYNACQNGRRTGSGITGLGDTLAALGIKYGSEKSIEVTDLIYKTLKHGCYMSSVEMAKELGPFPIWNQELEKDNPFLLRIKEENHPLWEDMQKYGRRNIALLTTAPTGTVSIEASMSYFADSKECMKFNISAGIEPVNMLKYIRRKKINHSEKDAKIDFIDQKGDKWTEFDVFHCGHDAWKEVNPTKPEEESPYIGACAEEINWTNRVKLQAAAQKHVDHSISSTLNLPEDVSEEEVAKIYLTAWESGCKGVTVYRKNSRSGVLVEKNKTVNRIQKTQAPERPKELTADIFHVIVRGKPYFVLVGLYEGEPYEIFAGKNGHLDKSVKKGVIIRKLKPRSYKAILEDGSEISPVTIACNEEEEAITRMVSIALRHGANVKFITEQLSKVAGDLNCFAKALMRALKNYIPEGENLCKQCESCGGNLIYSEGCEKCMSCGFSKCT